MLRKEKHTDWVCKCNLPSPTADKVTCYFHRKTKNRAKKRLQFWFTYICHVDNWTPSCKVSEMTVLRRMLCSLPASTASIRQKRNASQNFLLIKYWKQFFNSKFKWCLAKYLSSSGGFLKLTNITLYQTITQKVLESSACNIWANTRWVHYGIEWVNRCFFISVQCSFLWLKPQRTLQ